MCKSQPFMGGDSYIGGPELFQKSGWISHGEHASEQHSFIVFASIPASRLLPESLLWLPSMIRVWPEPYKLKQALPSLHCFCLWHLSTGIETLTKKFRNYEMESADATVAIVTWESGQQKTGQSEPYCEHLQVRIRVRSENNRILGRTKPSEHFQAHSRTECQVTGWQAGYKGRSLGEAAPRRI